MAVPNSSPDRSVPEFIARARADPGKVTYASSGVGTSLHLAGELFKHLAHVNLTHIPYRGAGPALNDLLPGRVDAIFSNFPSTLPYVQQGLLRGLAVTTAQRQAQVPDLPAIAEFVPGYDVSSWFALFVAAKTPARSSRNSMRMRSRHCIIRRCSSATRSLARRWSPPRRPNLRCISRPEMDRWGPIIKAAGIRADG
jgi:tripartite-type tricarboxylate transporter receptor subunit TctC